LVLKEKPFKSFITIANLLVSEGDKVSFSNVLNEQIEGDIIVISTKKMTIHREGLLNSETWEYSDIEEGSIKIL